jgi:hypothetical protein
MCMFGPSMPSAPPPAPTQDDGAVKAAAEAERRRASNAKGRASTILTGGQGDTTGAPVERPALKALLG